MLLKEIKEGNALLEFSPKELAKLDLSLLLRDRQLWFSATSEEQTSPLYLHKWSLTEPYAESLKTLFFEETLLAIPYQRSELALDEGTFFLLPEDLHGVASAKEWSLPFLSNEHRDRELLQITLSELPATLHYAIESELYHFCQRSFPLPHFTHPVATLIDLTLKRSRGTTSDILLVRLGELTMDLILARGGHLRLANRYHISALEDQIYYITLIWNRFGLRQEGSRLYIYSHLDLEPLHTALSDKIRQVYCNHYLDNIASVNHSLNSNGATALLQKTQQMPPEWIFQMLCV